MTSVADMIARRRTSPRTTMGRRAAVVALSAGLIAGPMLSVPVAQADNKRLNNSVVANVYTIQHQAGCTTNVKVNPQLQLAAQWHTNDMLTNRNLDGDIGSDGSTPQDRANAAGFPREGRPNRRHQSRASHQRDRNPQPVVLRPQPTWPSCPTALSRPSGSGRKVASTVPSLLRCTASPSKHSAVVCQEYRCRWPTCRGGRSGSPVAQRVPCSGNNIGKSRVVMMGSPSCQSRTSSAGYHRRLGDAPVAGKRGFGVTGSGVGEDFDHALLDTVECCGGDQHRVCLGRVNVSHHVGVHIPHMQRGHRDAGGFEFVALLA